MLYPIQMSQLKQYLNNVISHPYLDKRVLLIRNESWDRFELDDKNYLESMCKLINSLPNVSGNFSLN